MSGPLEKVSELLFGRTEQPDLPEAVIPAAPPTRRDDTGARVVVGADESKNKRVSGSKSSSGASQTTTDVLGSLGQGGLSV